MNAWEGEHTSDQSLTETLAALGYDTTPMGASCAGRRAVHRRAERESVFVGDAGEVWTWLEATWCQRCAWAEVQPC